MSHRKNQLYIPCEDFFLQPIYSCLHCRANLAHHRDLISKSFQGSQGRAYLFNNVVNVGSLVAEERMLLTGLHYVADIYCECCSFILGWKYERAFEPNQRYKEGKFIIELANLIKDNCWDTPSGPGTRARRLACPSRALFDHLDWWNKSNDSLLSNNNKTAVSTGASVIAVGAGSASEKPVTKFQSKTTFIRELSRDFQQLFGISDRSISGGHSNTNSNNTEEGNGNNNINNGNSNDNDNKAASYSDLVVLTDEISNSTMSTSIERQGDSYMRMNSDSDNIDSLIEYTTHCLPTNLLDQKSIEIQNDSMKSYSGSTDNNSLNTSFNSSKGLLEISCSSEKKVFDCKKSSNNNTKLFSKSGTCNSVHINHLKPFSDSSLSVSNGTSSKPHSKNHGRSRHKCRSRHSSNVVNPQRVINLTKNKPNVSSIEVVLSSTASNFQASQSDQNI